MSDKFVGTWRPHRPIGPIMAHYNSPGPKYMLPGSTGHPEHDIRKYRYPAYSFGDRSKYTEKERSPGPVYKLEKYYTRYGPDGSPIIHCHNKIPPLKTFNVPGPGTYRPEHAGPQAYFQAPKYSLHDRTKLAKSSTSPGPAAYGLKQIVGDKYSLQYSVTVRREQKEKERSPGPAVYTPTGPDIYKKRQPLWSTTARNYPPLGKSCAPGPGQHRPEKYTETGKCFPKKSFGIRHSVYAGLPKFTHDEV